MQKLKALFIKYKEIIMYLIFGVLTTVVSWVSYALFEMLFKGVIPDKFWLATVANVLSWIAAVLFAYVTNKLWVFESKSWRPSVVSKEFSSFVGSRLITGALEWGGVPLLMWMGLDMTLFGIEGMLAKIIISIFVVIGNYIISKLFVFRKKKSKKQR